MQLSVMDRLILSGLLPKEGNMLNLNAIKKAQEGLAFTEEEIAKWTIHMVDIETVTCPKCSYMIQHASKNYAWNNKDKEGKPVSEDAEIEIPKRVEDMIRKTLEDLEKKEKLTEQHRSLWVKFGLAEDGKE